MTKWDGNATKWEKRMFLGKYSHTIDSKGRLIIPAKYRDEIGDQKLVVNYEVRDKNAEAPEGAGKKSSWKANFSDIMDVVQPSVTFDSGFFTFTENVYAGMGQYKGIYDIKDGKWSAGKLFSVVVRNQGDFSLGGDIYVGMNVSELLLVYPMFDECNYQSSFKNVDGEFTLAFTFDDFGNVTRIDLGESVG